MKTKDIFQARYDAECSLAILKKDIYKDERNAELLENIETFLTLSRHFTDELELRDTLLRAANDKLALSALSLSQLHKELSDFHGRYADIFYKRHAGEIL